MINSDMTLYHKTFDDVNKLEVWQKYYIKNVWWYGAKVGTLDKGYDNNNSLDVRVWYNKNENLNIENFAIGDILVKGQQADITTQQDLIGLEIYNITGIKNNNFGGSPHIHLIGK